MSASRTADPLGEKPWFAKPGQLLKCVVTLVGGIYTDLFRELTERGLTLHTATHTGEQGFMYVFTGEMTQANRAAFDSELRDNFAEGIKAKQLRFEENSGGHISYLNGKSEYGNLMLHFAALTIPKA